MRTRTARSWAAPWSLQLGVLFLLHTSTCLTLAAGTIEELDDDDVKGPIAATPMPDATRVWIISAVLLLVTSFLSAVYLQPAWLMALVVRHSHPCVLWCASTSSPVCSLTIDDAPSASTPQILDLLQEFGVKATFFIISGNIQGREAIVERIVREGHALGNHLTEDRASVLDELHVFEQKLKECDRAIRCFQGGEGGGSGGAGEVSTMTATTDTHKEKDKNQEHCAEGGISQSLNVAPIAPVVSSTTSRKAKYQTIASKWLRPASGWFTSNMREVIMSHGYRICMGSVYPHDAQIKWSRLNAMYLRWRTRPGAVLIVHDRPWTIDVLRGALPRLARKFKFLSLDDLLAYHNSVPDEASK